MRVKIGDEWFEPKPDLPIMIELSSQDKINIQNMIPEAKRYAVYDTDVFSEEEILDWMKEGSKV